MFTEDGDGQVQFAEAGALTPEDCAAVQQQVRARLLRWFARAGPLDAADAREIASWDHGGAFPLDASSASCWRSSTQTRQSISS